MNVNAIRNIQEARNLLQQSCPVFNIQTENIESCPDNTVSIICDNSLDYTHVLTHAFTNPARSAVYVVKKKTKTKRRKGNSTTSYFKISLLDWNHFVIKSVVFRISFNHEAPHYLPNSC